MQTLLYVSIYNIAGKCIYVQGNQNEGGAKSAKMHGVQWYSYIIHKTVMTLQRTIKACYGCHYHHII